MSQKLNVRNITENEYFYGHKACGGCGESLALRLALKVLGDEAYLSLPAGCMAAVSFIYPNMAFKNNAIITPFASTAAVTTGVEAGLRALGKKKPLAVGFAGDGGTADIGIQALSGAIDRGEKFIYICTDNEAYMNTGIQKSGLTPFGAATTTTPAGREIRGNINFKKNMFEIVAAHGITYAATASIGYLDDMINKIQKAKDADGPSYIHIYAPCPTGWGCGSEISVDLGKQVVDNGLWYLAEYENGEFKVNRNPDTFEPVAPYLKRQGRFKHLEESDITMIESIRDQKWEYIRNNWV
ncbi:MULTISPECIES: thiamine pyrophosphate-dependent enzyme [unclassified Fusibacter]|uniref:thiamine pyrophosphate-dependent enzyme n=1 Tax=unclassified Fusibacter TaxID=2624464 RepID=UPI0010103598|nr:MULTISPECIES: thiamine pyrophosphate-dependent enzyme [unclassified Fusibacter]MCK8058736.1 thiamine pyrophosphate-dependent enzyme [Fusibacter sp. A2]NPE21810.1 pyruvate synthase subunit beta [Fusibacter sp. A1]RXV61382.1 pyruvate synthase subunit beta [Fusibacter sp. A1]